MCGCGVLLLFFILLIVGLILKRLYWLSSIPSLANQHVVVTGGSSGIGKAIAIEAAKRGAHVTIIARDNVRLEKAVEEIKEKAEDADKQMISHVSLNVTQSYNSVEQAFTEIETKSGPIYLLVNCAGTAVCETIEDATEMSFREMMNVNYFGTLFPTLVTAKKMKSRKAGHIVITGSQASLLGIFGMGAYCSSKFALRGLAESFYMELKPFNVFVTICLPPDTNTPGFEKEEKTKPEVTRLISETAGLFEPETVARQLLSDALNKKYYSLVGLEGLIVTTLCAGMSPMGSLTDILLQICSMSLLRLISCGYLLHFDRIIRKNVKAYVESNLASEKTK